MEGFNDIWANILNDKILVELTSYEEKPVEESKDIAPQSLEQKIAQLGESQEGI